VKRRIRLLSQHFSSASFRVSIRDTVVVEAQAKPQIRKRKAELTLACTQVHDVLESKVFFSTIGESQCANAPNSDSESEDETSNDFKENYKRRIKKLGRGKCKFLGVSWNSQHGKWIAQVGHMGKRHYVGQFEDCELAAIMIDRKCIELGIPPRNDTIPTPESLREYKRPKVVKRKRFDFYSEDEDWEEQPMRARKLRQRLRSNVQNVNHQKLGYSKKFGNNSPKRKRLVPNRRGRQRLFRDLTKFYKNK